MYNPKEVRMRAITCKITQTPDNLQTNKKKKKDTLQPQKSICRLYYYFS